MSSTYLWGHDFLITPILKPEETQVEVYFPENNIWFDFYSDERIEGGQTNTVFTNEISIPTYVRAGAFILMAKPMQTTEEYKASEFVLHYYHDASVLESEREYYNDDGKTPNAFEKGAYEILEFKAEIGTNYQSSEKQIKLVVHNINWIPETVKLNGKKTIIKKEANTLIIPVKWNTKKEAKIKISLK